MLRKKSPLSTSEPLNFAEEPDKAKSNGHHNARENSKSCGTLRTWDTTDVDAKKTGEKGQRQEYDRDKRKHVHGTVGMRCHTPTKLIGDRRKSIFDDIEIFDIELDPLMRFSQKAQIRFCEKWQFGMDQLD